MDKITNTNFLVAIVGRPNVGKSTLFNKIAGKNRAILSDIPGTTRDILYEKVGWNRMEFSLADTAGLELDKKDDLEQDILLQTKAATEAADLIIFVVDAHTGNQKEDLRAAEMIRKLNKPVILAINKAEGKKHDHTEHEFHNLGLGEPMLTSAVSGRGIGDLLDTVVNKLLELPQKTTKITEDDFDKEIIKVAIIGKPNVGKSTLINKLSGKKAAIVSNIPGTTRDTVTTDIPICDNHIVRLTDTAGLRRSGKIEKGIEKFSSLLVVKSVSDADIVLQLLDGPDGVTSQDLHIAQIALESKVGIILVVNKWDAVEKSQTITHEFEKYLGQKFIFMPWAPKVYISALSGRRATNVIEEIKNVWESLHTKIPAKDLNNLIIDAVASLPPRGRRKPPKIYFSHQINTNPPTIELKINFPEEIHSSYIRYLDKKIRAKYPLPGAPIDWKLTKSSTKDVL